MNSFRLVKLCKGERKGGEQRDGKRFKGRNKKGGKE